MRFTRTLAVLPPAVVYGRPMISYSPVSSGSPVADLKLHGEDASGAGWLGRRHPG
jgi:hypothetical protein